MEDRTGGRMSGGSAGDRGDEVERAQILYDSFPLPTFTWKKDGEDFVLIDFNQAAVTASQGNVPSFVGARAGEVYADRPDIIDDLRLCFESRSSISREMSYSHPAVGGPFDLKVTYVCVPPDMVVVHLEQGEKSQA